MPLPSGLDADGAPTLLEVWAPRCASCRAMEPDLMAAAADHPSVHLARIDATEHRETAASLRVLGTPTLIGFVDGEEAFRHTGRLNRAELDQLFDSLTSDAAPPVARADGWIRLAAGTALAAASLLVDPAWPLLAGGALVGGWGGWTLLQRGR